MEEEFDLILYCISNLCLCLLVLWEYVCHKNTTTKKIKSPVKRISLSLSSAFESPLLRNVFCSFLYRVLLLEHHKDLCWNLWDSLLWVLLQTVSIYACVSVCVFAHLNTRLDWKSRTTWRIKGNAHTQRANGRLSYKEDKLEIFSEERQPPVKAAHFTFKEK